VLLHLQASESAIRDTVDAVFRQPAFRPSIRETVLQRLLALLADFLEFLGRLSQESPVLYWSGVGLLVLIIAALLGRSIYLGYHRARLIAEQQHFAGGAGAGSTDPWAAANRLASEGRYTDAAHEVYRYLLASLSRRRRVRLHPSKTVGDYGRELRRSASPALPLYREFAGLYEFVVYGPGNCDRERFDRLRNLATGITGDA
jgi:hypothetical protein